MSKKGQSLTLFECKLSSASVFKERQAIALNYEDVLFVTPCLINVDEIRIEIGNH